MLEFFRARVRWLKESNRKESRFEKPYEDLEYRKMHVDWPTLDWPTAKSEVDIPSGVFGDLSGQNIIVWGPGNCWLGVANCECGESFTLTGSIVNLPPRTRGATFAWNVWAEDEEIRIDSVEPSEDGTTVEVTGTVIDEDFSGVATVCGYAVLVEGNLVQRTVWSGEPNQFSQWTEATLESEIVETDYYEGASYDCSCTMVSVECGPDCTACGAIAWDDDTSADTVAQSGNCTVAITDTDACGPYSWSVSGSGFTLDNATTSGLTNTLNAAADACGSAEVTVTDICSNEVVGYVRCGSDGRWRTCWGGGPAGFCYVAEIDSFYLGPSCYITYYCAGPGAINTIRTKEIKYCADGCSDYVGTVLDADDYCATGRFCGVRIAEWVCQ